MPVDGAQVFTQAHLKGTEHATAIITVPGSSTGGGAVHLGGGVGGASPLVTKKTVMYVSISSVLDKGAGTAAALAAVRAAANIGSDALTTAHQVRNVFLVVGSMILCFV